MLNILLTLSALLAVLAASCMLPFLARPRLRHFPGPFAAQFTDWWRFLHVRRTHSLQIDLHKKYGQAVRIGPNCISLSDASLIKTIYNGRGTFIKSNFYVINDVYANGHIIENIFGTRSNAFHRRFTRPIQSVYNMKSILQLEPLFDKTSEVLCRRLEEEFIAGEKAGCVCNLSDWLSFYAWDVDGEVTFDQPFGFLEQGTDLKEWMATSEKALSYFSRIGQIPILDYWLAKNPYVRLGGVGLDWAATYCAGRLFARYEEVAKMDKDGGGAGKTRADFLDHFISLKEAHPEVVDDFAVISYMVLNVLAGADTTAVTLRAVFYFLLKNPAAYDRLVAEVDAANLPDPIPYSQAASLPFLDAVIRESMRLYPAVAMLLERVVPKPGLTLSDGRVIPAGTDIGINPWVVGHLAEVFGDDREAFRPERWLKQDDERDEDFAHRLAEMKAADLSFGAGNRICIGKNFAICEMWKIVPTLLRRFKFELADPEEECTVICKWLAFQDAINVKLARR